MKTHHALCGLLSGLLLLAAGTAQIHAGLIGHWTFDEASSGTGTGIALDSSGNAYNGTINGGALYVSGQVGTGALSFDGVNDLVNVGAVSGLNLTGGSYSIGFWVNFNGTQVVRARMINMDDGGDFSGGYSFHSGPPSGGLSHNNGSNNNAEFGPLSTGVWHQVTAVYDSSLAKRTLYYDGVSQR